MRLSENALFPKLCVILKKLFSKYQLDVCGNFLSKPLFWKKLLFPDSLIVAAEGKTGFYGTLHFEIKAVDTFTGTKNCNLQKRLITC
ncbi:MAG: hypothetical protein B1H11_02850 [Desulfobacteraceae bacterium 4484_190.1]|nr:MAG: hypothetical protein B1H11_02850 [Desulfobacteraceae bacterium 4484_190.1]